MSETLRQVYEGNTMTDAPHRCRHRLRLALPLVAVAAGAGAVKASGPRAGRLTYDLAMAAESRLRGLHTKYAEVDGLRMAYYEGGRAGAPTIVMVHGFTADRDVWIRFAGHLVRDYHVVIPDLAGHGDTGEAEDYSIPGQAARVAGLLDALGIEQAHIIGNSMGGGVAARVAINHPGHVLTLGLVDAAGVEAPSTSPFFAMLDEGHNPFLTTSVDQFDAFYAMTMSKPPFAPGYVRAAIAQQYVDRCARHTDIFDQIFEKPWLDDLLHEITVPTLVMWGAQDQLLDPTGATLWADGIAGSELIVYDDLGHMPMMEAPRRSAKDYAAFLARS